MCSGASPARPPGATGPRAFRRTSVSQRRCTRATARPRTRSRSTTPNGRRSPRGSPCTRRTIAARRGSGTTRACRRARGSSPCAKGWIPTSSTRSACTSARRTATCGPAATRARPGRPRRGTYPTSLQCTPRRSSRPGSARPGCPSRLTARYEGYYVWRYNVKHDTLDLGRFTEPALHILVSLAEGPKHGYAMMDDIEIISGWASGPGTLYGALGRLERLGYVEALASRDRGVPCRLTDSGRRALEAELAGLRRLTATGIRRLSRAGGGSFAC